MEHQRPLEYTVKIYCEGFTEWYYFEWLRTNNRFKFSMEPDIPKICILKYAETRLSCIFPDGKSFEIDDTISLTIQDPVIDHIAKILE